MCFDWQKIALYLASRLLSSFLPRRKRRALRRHYNWLYGRIMVGWARGMYQQAHAFELSKESLRQIVFGSSHAYYGYLPNDGEFLLATGSQDLYTSYELYCRVSELRSLKRVVLFVSVFSPGFQTERSVYREMCLYLRHYWAIPYRLHDAAYYQNRLRQLQELEPTFLDVETAGYRGGCDYSFFMGPGLNVEQRVQGHLKNNRRGDGGELTYLDKFLALAAKCGHEVLVVIPPARSDYVSHCPSNEELFGRVYAVLGKHPQARLLDLFISPEFDDSDFGDSDHINRKGAEKLSALIRNQLQGRT